MRRFYSLWLYAVLFAAIVTGALQSLIEERRLVADSRSRSAALMASLEESVAANVNAHRPERIAKTLMKLESEQQHLALGAVCVYDAATGATLAVSRGFPAGTSWLRLCENQRIQKMAMTPQTQPQAWTSEDNIDGESVKLSFQANRIETNDDEPGVLVLAQDISYLRSRWIESFVRGFVPVLVIGLTLLFLITTQMRRWLKRNLAIFHRSLKSIIAGRRPNLRQVRTSDTLSELRPLTDEIDQLARILSSHPVHPLRAMPLSPWEKGLSPSMTRTIAQKELVVIANREPYIHKWKGDQIEVMRPASGLVTALEPILRQCGGLWVAHGGGSADYDVADANGEVPVPPEKPTYTLKRVKLTQEQEEGYYYGFSNEGLWPLCHLAHTRPIFRLSDWQQYVQVNQLFANAIPESVLNRDSLFLVQDYHFALLPGMLKKRASRFRRPRDCLFWHIPWPNPEAFGICPWNQDLLRGMLGADVIGFHTQYHCNNFLESCNRYLEARIDYEHFTVTMGNHETKVQAFPIGIDTSPVRTLSNAEREELKLRYGIRAKYVAVGVDRIDYTKGIIERIEAIERFLEKNPQYVGQFSFVQMGSPSRTHIPAYKSLHEQLDQIVARINDKFAKGPNVPEGYRPVIFLPEHHEWKDIQYFYQLGDVCLVTSLHDGMNLVAKEYVWCQQPERGSLILSKFTGASRELTEAFIVNPYSIEEIADAIAQALALTPEERGSRMMPMREKVHARSAYRWAGDLIEALLRKDGSEISRLPAPDRRDRLRSAGGYGMRPWP